MDKTTKKLFAVFAFLPLLAVVLTMRVGAAEEVGVTATVTAQSISVAVTDSDVTYGTVSTSSTRDTTVTEENESQTAENDGSVSEDFNMKGQNSADWGLGTTAGSESYTHKYCNSSDCDGSPSWTALTTGYALVYDSVAITGTRIFDLQVGTPTSTSNYGSQSVDITVQAVTD